MCFIRRGEQNIIPDGETIILQNDVLVLSAITPDEVHGIKLVEKIIEKDSRYNNKLLSEISKTHAGDYNNDPKKWAGNHPKRKRMADHR